MRRFHFFIPIIFALITFIVPTDIFSQEVIRNLSTIVIDPGFGGKDTGPVSCNKSIYAKDINLQIAKKLAERIKNTINVKTICTSIVFT
jgi:N-acetylmuramoyl-L-alanine amidase